MMLRELPQPMRGVSMGFGGDGPQWRPPHRLFEQAELLCSSRVMTPLPGRNVSCLLMTQRNAHLEFNDNVDSAAGSKRG
jgi:hypothetical protein